MNDNIFFFRTPDSSLYIVIKSFNIGLVEKPLSSLIKKIKGEKKVRILFNLEKQTITEDLEEGKTKEFKIFIKKLLETNSISKNVLDYSTNFYYLSKENAFKIKRNTLIGSDFEVILVKQPEDLKTALNFQENSFGVDFFQENGRFFSVPNETKQVKIRSFFKEVLEQKNISLFLVKNTKEEFVGSFALFSLGNEVQLHSVAGVSKDLNIYKNQKLPILLSKALDLFLNNEKYRNCTKITLSSSKQKVAEKYEKFGFKKTGDRAGFLIV